MRRGASCPHARATDGLPVGSPRCAQRCWRTTTVEEHAERFGVEKGMAMKVWIDQDLCTGDGLCEEIAPAVFTLLDDGLAYVKEGDSIMSDPGGQAGLATVPAELEDAAVEASEECPGECIFIERD